MKKTLIIIGLILSLFIPGIILWFGRLIGLIPFTHGDDQVISTLLVFPTIIYILALMASVMWAAAAIILIGLIIREELYKCLKLQ